MKSHVIDIIHQDRMHHQNLINLNASENYISQCVKEILLYSAYETYQFPPSRGKILGNWQFDGESTLDLIGAHLKEYSEYFFGSPHMITGLRGGQYAEIAMLLSFCQHGGKAFCVAGADGGHFGLNIVAQKCGIELYHVIFDQQTHMIDIEQTIDHAQKYFLKEESFLFILNQSFLLKPQDYQAIAKAVKLNFPNCILTCDVSHVLGLMIGKVYPNPLNQGFDIIHGSTHKTLPGPQQALIVFNKSIDLSVCQIVNEIVSPGLQSYCGTAETYMLATVFAEMQIYGQDLAKATCRHAQILAMHLANLGLEIIGENFGYTTTHQVWLSIGDETQAWQAFSDLHSVGIRCLPTHLPFIQQWGIRLGSNAMTRRGFTEIDFTVTAELIAATLFKKRTSQILREEVKTLTRSFPTEKTVFSF